MKEVIAYSHLRNSGLRMTPLKRKVVDLFLSGACGLSSGDVFAELGGNHDQSSVYRCLESLVKAGFLRHGLGKRGVVLYRCERTFFPDHGHFICRSCGETIPLENSFASDLIKEIESSYGVKVNSVDFMLEGKCENCSKYL